MADPQTAMDVGRTVLVVDDDEALRGLLSLGLRRADFVTIEASSGEEALRILETRSASVLVMDLGMPGMSGLDVLRALRQRPETATLPILLMTGSGSRDTVLEALAAGADDFLTKPIRLDELVARVRAHLRIRTALAHEVEAELRIRADVVGALGALTLSAEPEELAAALVEELGRGADCHHVAVMQLADRDRLIVLATYDEGVGVRQGGVISLERDRYLRSRLRDGPWVEIVGPPGSDAGQAVGNGTAELKLAAGAPIYHGTRVIGLLITGLRRVSGGPQAQQARTLAAVIDYASILSVAAGSSIAHRRRATDTRSRLARVLSDRAFHPVFQPIVRLSDQRVVGFEALTRFDDGVEPDVRFAEAGLSGLGLDYEIAAIEAALEASIDLPPDVFISLNGSPALVLDRARLGPALAATDRPIVLELTEHARIDDYVDLRAALESYGPQVRVAVDDAGAGYASLRHILELRPAFVKLDLSIVTAIEHDPVRQALVSALVYFSGKTGSELIAEGIETESEAGVLRELGISFGQGYLFGRPTRR
jgi:EAL domain-containing protein (putative c-di-GMP-specific phosphodiesterase class I)/DNA-binding NarL/FixJ family response regulator